MPSFESEAQRRFMYTVSPTLAKEFEKNTKKKKEPSKKSSVKPSARKKKK